MYADFVESFEVDESAASAGPSFVRGETVSQGVGDVGPQARANPNAGSCTPASIGIDCSRGLPLPSPPAGAAYNMGQNRMPQPGARQSRFGMAPPGAGGAPQQPMAPQPPMGSHMGDDRAAQDARDKKKKDSKKPRVSDE